ncbi:jerky protein homolog-like [Ornithorhynchus anatinus]|uniref:jerky protein homolog-like n=1 Tax=Ornithorhynchus anatinus TaxID=9258 RepID=UPI0010A86028|nr:jerky protein homolog-like [Ornithorhynchus anatinus]XP_028914743.1 jerky protein homolog-like [Ornithorhynchus anatinus]XP_028914747.1 jerky protein homolog-like [Ornithorhynchus anatinus]XP_028914756.1 jerky protein homolog-like [Ornithorhynchus anatinus]
MVCANSSGSHRLPLLLIEKSKTPRPFRNVKKLPVVYRNQTKAWMNTNVFLDWYDNSFIPEVKAFQKKNGKEGKVLLILDNAPTHPSTALLERENGNFKVLFLPLTVASAIQPMNQGVIETLKRLYRKQLLRRLLMAESADEENTVRFFKSLDLKDCCYMLADSWDSVKSSTLKNSWNNIFKTPGIAFSRHPEANGRDENSEIMTTLQEIPGCSDCGLDDVKEWLNCDSGDPGYEILSEEEILAAVEKENRNEIKNDEEKSDVIPSHS